MNYFSRSLEVAESVALAEGRCKEDFYGFILEWSGLIQGHMGITDEEMVRAHGCGHTWSFWSHSNLSVDPNRHLISVELLIERGVCVLSYVHACNKAAAAGKAFYFNKGLVATYGEESLGATYGEFTNELIKDIRRSRGVLGSVLRFLRNGQATH